MKSLLSRFSLSLLLPAHVFASPLVVTIKNGTIQGRHSSEWNQDFFLGIPYAQPPLGDLRFRWPQSINTSFEATFEASHYGHSCYQYGTNFNLSEDCLTINGTLCLLLYLVPADLSSHTSIWSRARETASTGLGIRRRINSGQYRRPAIQSEWHC
jgi:hypothetical protein